MLSIIIVDDEDFITTSLSKYISKHHPDFNVKGTFTDAESALTYLQSATVDVIITDILMPQMDGLEMIKRVRKLLPEVSILIISGYSEFEYAQKACVYNVQNYLLKPIDYQELSDNLELISKQLLKTQEENIYEEEDIQLFFIDLLSRMITGKKELYNRLHKTSLAENADNYKGRLISITLDNSVSKQWKYGIDTLSTALLNIIRMHLPEYESYYLYRHHMCFFFIILSQDSIPSFPANKFAECIKQMLQCSCNIKTAATFYKIEALLSSPDISKPSYDRERDNNTLIQHAINYIQHHYADNLSREDVANIVYLDSAYFSRLFKQITGTSFINYLTTVRMKKAAELLETQMNINDIASAVGYLHRNRFITNFRQYSGYTPTEYRKKILIKREQANE